MSFKTVLFDLDGTLLPMEQDVFLKDYMKRLCETFAGHGYEPRTFLDTIMSGVEVMVRNDGGQSNKDAFMRSVSEVYGDRLLEDYDLFDEFYLTEFQKVKEVCGCDPLARETVRSLKERGIRCVLATNPLFPFSATESRIRWAGLVPEDFDVITTYDNSRYSKPNPLYYRDILDYLDASPEDCLMVGNDTTDDLAAEKVGIRVFFITKHLINRDNKDMSLYPHGDFSDLLEFISKE